MVSPYYGSQMGAVPRARNILEHLEVLRWFYEHDLAKARLRLLLLNLDDPQWIKDKEEEWLSERKYWNGFYSQDAYRTSIGFDYGGEEWE